MNSISNNLTGGISSEAPQFSVVIPLYNKAHTIVSTMATVINQIYKNFEVVIVDDGSTDNGAELVRSHFDDPRIRIIYQETEMSFGNSTFHCYQSGLLLFRTEY